jgi:hypothetical protein
MQRLSPTHLSPGELGCHLSTRLHAGQSRILHHLRTMIVFSMAEETGREMHLPTKDLN